MRKALTLAHSSVWIINNLFLSLSARGFGGYVARGKTKLVPISLALEGEHPSLLFGRFSTTRRIVCGVYL